MRKKLSWHLDVPGFERIHWWRLPEWEALIRKSEELDGRTKSSPQDQVFDLKAAIAWEVLRRLPFTGGLLATRHGPVPHASKRNPAAGKNRPNLSEQRSFAAQLLRDGHRSWISLAPAERQSFSETLNNPSYYPASVRSTEGTVVVQFATSRISFSLGRSFRRTWADISLGS